MTDPLDALQAADEARTPGPWEVGVSYNFTRNADFIALCGTHVPTLLARLRAAEAVVEAADRLLRSSADIAGGESEWVPVEQAVVDALAKYREVAG